MRIQKRSIKLGGERLTPEPLTLERALELVLLLAPHLARIEAHLPEIRAALETTGGDRPDLLTTVFTALRDELTDAPGDMTKALALLVDRDPPWVAERVTAREFVAALPVLDRVNDLGGLWAAVQALGITLRYKENGKPGTD